MRFDHAHWQNRLDTLRERHLVPGASPAVPVVFSRLTNGTPCVYIGMRATPKSA
ncbi:hypothetical protein [Nocardiopsis sp. CNR-923]|uniref:hypothetical protein n=1 Tax=Nocardiopsis sp. CNR-923 TaxID=1904965 RepID=UPI0013017533|nr:hypothetical protein [Nocardiopsis sp. CNR-923]